MKVNGRTVRVSEVRSMMVVLAQCAMRADDATLQKIAEFVPQSTWETGRTLQAHGYSGGVVFERLADAAGKREVARG